MLAADRGVQGRERVFGIDVGTEGETITSMSNSSSLEWRATVAPMAKPPCG